MSDADGDSRLGVWMDLGDDGSITLPSETLAAAHLIPGGRVMVRVIDGMVQLMSHMSCAIEIQNRIDKGLDPGPLMSDIPGTDGLFVERRRDFLLEGRDFPAKRDAAE
jgi:hypothetical protein